jgi:hypothetical protein
MYPWGAEEEGFYLNLADFPMYQAETPYHEMCGPAVAQMTLNYIWWNSSNHSSPPLLFDDQQWLYDRGIENNSNTSLPYLDTRGLWYIIQYNKPMPYNTFGYNFMKYNNEELNEVLKRIVLWINYTVGSVGGHKPGHPYHVPTVVPAYGDYTNWMAIRGFRSNRTAYPMPDAITIYGFWVNDPYPSTLGGLGENSYKALSSWLSDYYHPLETDDVYDSKYVAILEPPEISDNVQLSIAEPRVQFTRDQIPLLQTLQQNRQMSQRDQQTVYDWIIQAAINGVAQELLPYDEHFAWVFNASTPGTPMYIIDLLGGEDYYAVPFHGSLVKTKSILTKQVDPLKNTNVVVLLDAEDGRFKEASWVAEPVRYLPITRQDVLAMLPEICKELGLEEIDPDSIVLDLVHKESTPYYPHWRLLFEEYGIEVFIGQDGSIS